MLTAASGRDGIARRAPNSPDAILLDVMMPDIDGQRRWPNCRPTPAAANVPVVFLTAKAQSADRTRLGQLGNGRHLDQAVRSTAFGIRCGRCA